MTNHEQSLQAFDLLKELVAIPSVSCEETHAADRLEKYIRSHSLHYLRKGNNIACIPLAFNPDKPTILLNAHIDTVKPVNGWKRNPFTPIVEDNRLYGLGSNDCGGGLVALLMVYLQLHSTAQAYNLIFLASCEEEISGKNGIECILPDLPPITLGLVGEPTGMQPAIAEKGLMVLDVTTRGKAGHAARNEGVNAIYEALPDIEWFRTYHFPEESPLLGPVKMSVTQINAGTQHNVVPDTCTFVVDIRSNEFYNNEELFKIITSHIRGEVHARSFRLNSSRIDPGHPIIRRAEALKKQPFGSPTLSDQALMPFPSFKMGPGQSSRSHTADEYITFKEIEEAISIYLQLLDGLRL